MRVFLAVAKLNQLRAFAWLAVLLLRFLYLLKLVS